MASEQAATAAPFVQGRAPTSSLQTILLILLAVAIALPSLVFGALLIHQFFQRTVLEDAQTKAESYVELLQGGMTMPLWNIAPELGRPLIRSVEVDSSVKRIEVIDGRSDPFLLYLSEGYQAQADDILISREVSYRGEQIGRVLLRYSLADAKAHAWQQLVLLLAILLAQLVCSFALMSYFLRRRVTVPLLRLEAAAEGIACGDLRTRVPPMGNDEFGRLAQQLESMRDALHRAFFQLEAQVSERTADLESVNVELNGTLNKLQRAQSELVQSEKLAALGALVAGVAHELNTPIGNGLTVATSLAEATRVIDQALAEGLKRSTLDRYLAEMAEGTQLVCLSLQKAAELLSSFKQVAVDRTSAQRRRFSLAAVLREIRLTMATLLKHTPYTLAIDVPENITLDSYPGPLGQVLSNLVDNAVRHGFDGADRGTIRITGKISGAAVELRVSDDGAGIPSEYLPRIFDPFYTTKLGRGGSGLGLHIVHNIVNAVLGGSLTVASTEGEGTTFVITLPLVAPTVEAANNNKSKRRDPGAGGDNGEPQP